MFSDTFYHLPGGMYMIRSAIKYVLTAKVYLQIYFDANRLLVVWNVINFFFKFPTHLGINEMSKIVQSLCLVLVKDNI